MSTEDFSSTHKTKETFSIPSESLNTTTVTELPSTSQVNTENCLVVEYSKQGKKELFDSILENPTIDANGVNWYVCPFCNEAASDPNNLIPHFEQHFCTCPTCGLYFTSVEVLTIHKQTCEEKINSIDEQVIVANKIDEVEKVEETQDEQEKKQSVRRKWTPKICTQCGKQYRTNYKLQEHMRKHTGEKPFQCSMCEKAFRSKIGLAQHFATHTGQFDYNCSTCGKGFQCKSYLIVHQRVGFLSLLPTCKNINLCSLKNIFLPGTLGPKAISLRYLQSKFQNKTITSRSSKSSSRRETLHVRSLRTRFYHQGSMQESSENTLRYG